ncbi:interactor of HORMAD1 protein 1 [Suncus etruscus]|uniref:interactor of HORMAD1 protein 1 n=1 Tax=Suncus etruscus TaxID=109475 RepID=UPI0021102D34|nr:interactor of HORMAD1 protein 1 [Suncus etruscus]
MNFNVWNIKDMLTIPSGFGTTKSSNWDSNQTDHSNLSDSQFLFGSQFCPESLDTQSAPLDFGGQLRNPKQSQQNSLDSEPSIFTKYQTKPQLFGGDVKNGSLFPLPLSVRKSKGFLKQFEEKTKRAKDECESETLYNFIFHVRDSIDRLQTSMEKSEEHLNSRNQFIVDSLETVVTTLHETSRSQKDLLLERVQDNGNLEQAILEMQKKFEARQAEFVEMKSKLEHLEVLVAQQSKDLQQLGEQLCQLNVPGVLTELKSLISRPEEPRHMKDSASQTSACLAPSLSFTRLEACASKDSALQQVQAQLAIKNLNVDFPPPGNLSDWDKGAQHDALEEEAVLLAVGTGKVKQNVKDQAVQTIGKNCTRTNAISKNLSIDSILPEDLDLYSQGASPLVPLNSDNLATSIKSNSQKRHIQDVLLIDSCEQELVTDKKGRTRTRGIVRKGKHQQPRKAYRGWSCATRQEQTLNNTCGLSSKQIKPAGTVLKRTHQKKQVHFDLITHLDPALGESVMLSKRAEEHCLQPTGHSCQDISPQRDHQISWFSDLGLNSSDSPLCKEPENNLLYNLTFDSSDDSF